MNTKEAFSKKNAGDLFPVGVNICAYRKRTDCKQITKSLRDSSRDTVELGIRAYVASTKFIHRTISSAAIVAYEIVPLFTGGFSTIELEYQRRFPRVNTSSRR